MKPKTRDRKMSQIQDEITVKKNDLLFHVSELQAQLDLLGRLSPADNYRELGSILADIETTAISATKLFNDFAQKENLYDK
jgi:hypothetical protein